MLRLHSLPPIALLSMLGVSPVASIGAQARPAVAPAAAPAAAPPAPPATKLGGFRPSAGSVLQIAFTESGAIGGITVSERELRDQQRAPVRGLVVDVRESEYRHERSFVDADEIAELIKAVDHLLTVTENPSPSFANFELRYANKGELEVVAFNRRGDTTVMYAVEAGRGVSASAFLDATQFRGFRELLVRAQAGLARAAAATTAPRPGP
jgi:hypothetical protein